MKNRRQQRQRRIGGVANSNKRPSRVKRLERKLGHRLGRKPERTLVTPVTPAPTTQVRQRGIPLLGRGAEGQGLHGKS